MCAFFMLKVIVDAQQTAYGRSRILILIDYCFYTFFNSGRASVRQNDGDCGLRYVVFSPESCAMAHYVHDEPHDRPRQHNEQVR